MSRGKGNVARREGAEGERVCVCGGVIRDVGGGENDLQRVDHILKTRVAFATRLY